jgi:hypothetical protein
VSVPIAINQVWGDRFHEGHSGRRKALQKL